MKAVLDAVIERCNAITAAIDRSLDRLEAEKICDYQPLFRGDGKPSHDSVRLWARGLWKAMTPTLYLDRADEGRTRSNAAPPLRWLFEPDQHQPFDIDRPENSTRSSTRMPPRSPTRSSFCVTSPCGAPPSSSRRPTLGGPEKSAATTPALADQARNTSAAAPKTDPSTHPVRAVNASLTVNRSSRLATLMSRGGSGCALRRLSLASNRSRDSENGLFSTMLGKGGPSTSRVGGPRPEGCSREAFCRAFPDRLNGGEGRPGKSRAWDTAAWRCVCVCADRGWIGRNLGIKASMKIAQIAPLYESCPPRMYGGTERVVSYLTEELVEQGHEITLFASGDLETRRCWSRGCGQLTAVGRLP